MCGIAGYIGKRKASDFLINALRRLVYRGYDSAGMAIISPNGIEIRKAAGSIEDVDKKVKFTGLIGDIGIAHTRWSTHGPPTDSNAHPHLSCDGKFAVVHNGIIENYAEIKNELQKKGCKFKSETDSEIIVHYFEQKLKEGKPPALSIRNFIKEAKGTFAILLLVKNENRIYALRRDSPLVLGVGANENYIASDIHAFSDKTKRVIFFEDDEYAVISADGYQFFREGSQINKDIKTFDWEEAEEGKKEYEHFMLKEIMEEPEVVKRLLLSLETDQKEAVERLIRLIKASHKIVFVASGTSYHATLLGAYYLHKCNIEAQTLIASEFEHFASIGENTLVIALSQSGETMDVIDALKYAKERHSKIVAVVNAPYSTIQRMADLSINILAGQEICVAATKSFVNQVALLLYIARQFGFETVLEDLPEKIRSVFENILIIKNTAKNIAQNRDIYVLGRGLSYPVAREIALKIKEISYIHAEGMMGGELKHGTIALIEEGTPVISLVCNHDAAMLSNTKEVEARGAKVIIIGTDEGDIILPTKQDGTFGILATVVGQLLAYHIAKERRLPIDRPRNLAKSVTVR